MWPCAIVLKASLAGLGVKCLVNHGTALMTGGISIMAARPIKRCSACKNGFPWPSCFNHSLAESSPVIRKCKQDHQERCRVCHSERGREKERDRGMRQKNDRATESRKQRRDFSVMVPSWEHTGHFQHIAVVLIESTLQMMSHHLWSALLCLRWVVSLGD